MTTGRFARMLAAAPAPGRKQFLCCSIYSTISIRMFEWQQLPRSGAWGDAKLVRFSLDTFANNHPRN